MSVLKDNGTIIKILIAIVVLVLSFIVIKYGMYIDENGLLIIYRGIYQGNHMFTDSWSSYHLVAILLYPVFELYYGVLEPIIYPMGVGIVLYTRIIYIIFRALIAIYLYTVLRRSNFRDGAYAASLFFFLYVLAWKNFSYKSLCDFGIILFICFLIRYYCTKKPIYFMGMALATCLSILAYPTMILFPFVFCIALLIMMRQGHTLVKPFWIYVCTCFISGALYLIYLQLTTGIMNALPQMKYLEDSDYDYSMPIRIGLMLASYAVFAVIAYGMLFLIKLIGRLFAIRDEQKDLLVGILWLTFLVAILCVRVQGISVYRFGYALIIIMFWFIFYVNRPNGEEYTKIGSYKLVGFGSKQQLISILAISITAQSIWGFSTNQDISVPSLMAYYVAIAMMLWIAKNRKSMSALSLFIILAAMFFSFICIPEKNGGFYSVFEKRYYVEEGALRGIALLPDDYEKNKACFEILNENVSDDDYLLVVFGSNSTAYLNSNAKQAMGTPYTRTHLNKRLLEYWECNPGNVADYVLVDTDCDKYEIFIESETGKFILNEYTNVVSEKNGFVLLSK